jgi:hypothetical protein
MRNDLHNHGAGNDNAAADAERPRPRNGAVKRGMNDILKVLIFLVIWFIIMVFILPRLGVPT